MGFLQAAVSLCIPHYVPLVRRRKGPREELSRAEFPGHSRESRDALETASDMFIWAVPRRTELLT